ncbi:TraX family protein [Fusibacter bizertensis]|uniref:TraX family protein n=1 Tax=Fusibacter bizertensis TaxID=1488331 RepID=A0ABT6N946_9FIRM|nr:TraX family protein [Fusibacter bizertensis]MDH8676942.1 TraX family protein [Fusibacter bizertensis]
MGQSISSPRITNNLDTNFIKMFAIITMLIDHIGKILYPDVLILQIIGRIAFPLFAYCIVVGVLYTNDVKQYVLRLALCGIVSQPFYVLAFDTDWLVSNIFLTLLVGVLVIQTIVERRWILLGLLIVFSGVSNIDYGLRGILLMIVFYVFRENPRKSILMSTLILILPTVNDLIFQNQDMSIQGVSVLALPLIYLHTDFNLRINKFVFYSFYPIHLLTLYLVKNFVL